ncbi:MAG: mandelate racemase/muconate lactonizing enzyme family protein [Methylobacteriaceae bacterium]|nr:mandelate racemase/muconate lactonizing enzyme family protein [Methylobacteriaceae bacterium]
MKITSVETLQLAEFPFLLWLRLHTDAGLIGTGETFFAAGPVAAYIHDNVAPYLVGTDPRNIELHDRKLGSVYVGARDSGAEMRGNSAVNLALWDIYGQVLGEPVWRLLGGRTHETVPIYNTCAGYGHIRATKRNALFERTEDWSLRPEAPAEGPYEDLLAFRFNADKLAESLLGEGIKAMKIWPFDVAAEASNGTRIAGPDLDQALEPFRKIRAAVGNAMEIMVELHGLWTVPCALRIAAALEPFGPAWLEEPVRFNELDGLAELARHTSIPIATSERLATRAAFRQIIDRRAASIIMIDIAWCGGLSEARKIANMAEACELPVTLHDCTGPIVFAASCALSATLPNVNYQEAVRAYFTGWYREVVDRLPEVADGAVTPLDGPGLGLALKPEIFERSDATIRVSRL